MHVVQQQLNLSPPPQPCIVAIIQGLFLHVPSFHMSGALESSQLLSEKSAP